MTKPTSTTTNTRTKFKIHVFPHVKRFILKNYGGSEPVKTEEYGVLGKMVTLALKDNRAQSDYNDQYRDRLTTTLTITLTSEQSKMSPRQGKIMRINIHMDSLFKEHLLAWISALKVNGIAPYTACKMFLDYYELDENEYSLNTAYQYYKRANGLKN